MNALDRAAESLMAAAGDLDVALDADDDAALSTAFARREQAFLNFRNALDGPVPATVRILLRRIAELDARVLSRAEADRESIRVELSNIRRAHIAVRALEPRTESPRFVSRRA